MHENLIVKYMVILRDYKGGGLIKKNNSWKTLEFLTIVTKSMQ